MKHTGITLFGDRSSTGEIEDCNFPVNKQAEGCDCYPELRLRIAELDKEVAYLKAENEILTNTGQVCWL